MTYYINTFHVCVCVFYFDDEILDQTSPDVQGVDRCMICMYKVCLFRRSKSGAEICPGLADSTQTM